MAAEAASHDHQRQGPLDWSDFAASSLGGAIKPFTHTGRYIAQSWRDYLDQAPNQLPIARPTLALAAQAFRDEIVLTGLKARRPVSRPEAFEHITREVIAGLEFYGNSGWLENPAEFFTEPPPLPQLTIRHVRGYMRSFYRLSYDSGYRPCPGEPGARRWRTYTGNNREYALLLRHPQPRPWLVCVHGTEMGVWGALHQSKLLDASVVRRDRSA